MSDNELEQFALNLTHTVFQLPFRVSYNLSQKIHQIDSQIQISHDKLQGYVYNLKYSELKFKIKEMII